MNMRNILGGAMLLAATSALCTTETAQANCNSILVYDNGFPQVCVVVASQVNNLTGLAPAGADDFTVFAAGMKINDIHWYTAEPSAAGIGWAGTARVTIWSSLAACGGPNKGAAAVVLKNYGSAPDGGAITRTIVDASAVSVGGVAHDIVRYDLTKIDINLIGTAGGTKYWLSLQPISTGPNAPGNSLWMSTRCEVNGDVLVGCGAFSDPDTNVAGGWTIVGVPAAGDEVDLNFQLTRCDTAPCPANLDTTGGSANQIDVFDLFVLLSNWNTNGPGASLAAPTNVVDVFDLFVLLSAFGQLCPAGGTNNSCDFATLLIGPLTRAYSTAGATSDGPNDGGGCGIAGGQPDIWYCWKAECTGFTNINLSGAHGIRVYAGGGTSCGDCGALGAPIGCSSVGSVRFLATAGNHYRIRISGNNVSGNMVIDDCEPFNDECEDAIIIETGDVIMGTLLGYNTDPSAPNCNAVDPGGTILGNTVGVWYVTIGDGTRYTASTCFAGGQDDIIAVYCGSSCDGLQAECVLTSGSAPCGQAPGTQSTVSWCTVTGVIYFVYVAMGNTVDTPGAYQLSLTSNLVSCTPTSFEAGCPGIPGDVCAHDEDTSRGIGVGGNCQIPDQQGNGAGGTLAATSDRNPGFGFLVADDFSVAATGTITTVCWWGIYNNFAAGADCAPGDGGGGNDDFRIRILSHNATDGVPNAQLASYTIGALGLNTQKIYSGNDTGGVREEWEFTATLNPAFNATAGTCYWIEISNNTGGTCAWLWSTTPEGNARSAQDADGDGLYAGADCSDYDLAWCLNRALGNIATVCGSGCTCFEPVSATCQNLGGGNGYYQCPAFNTAYVSDISWQADNMQRRRADNFQVAGAGQSISSVCWWVLYATHTGAAFAACPALPPPSPFTIKFFANGVNNLPDTTMQIGGTYTVTPTRTDTGVPFGAFGNIQEMSATLAPALAVTDGTILWMEIQMNPNQTCDHLWVDSDLGDVRCGAGPATGAYTATADDMAFRLNITAVAPAPPPPPPVPVNDLCANASPLTPNTGTFISVNNESATPAVGPDPELPAGSPTCHWNNTPTGANHTVWYTVQMPAGHTRLRVEGCTDIANGANTMNDSTIVVCSGACGSLVQVGCGEDECAAGAAPYYSDTGLITGLTPGQTYRVAVMNPGGTGNADVQGTILIRVTTQP